jgi:multifunctional methyltransferase subunit TRM112
MFVIDLMKNIIGKINYIALQSALKDLSMNDNIIQAIEERKSLPNEEIVKFLLESDAYWKDLHHLLFEFHIINGVLVCPTTGREFVVKDGIPNMLLHEDEV